MLTLHSGKLILVVDDEPAVLRTATTALAEAGFRVIVAEDGAAGLQAFANSADAIDLVVTDIVMPYMDGILMAEEIRSIRPDVPIVLMTAYSDVMVHGLPFLSGTLVRKPFLPDDLIWAVWEQLAPPATCA